MKTNISRDKVMAVALRVFAIASFVVVLVVGMWGSVQVAKAVPSAMSSLAAAIASLSSIFIPAGSAEEIVVSAPTLTVISGEEVALSWEHIGRGSEGSYSFRYNCADGVHFISPASSGSEGVVFCNVPFNFLNANDSLTLTAVSQKNRFIDVTLFIDFTPNGTAAVTVSGTATLTIINENLSTSPSVLTPDTTATETPAVTTTPSTPTQTTTPPPAPKPTPVVTTPPPPVVVVTPTAPVSNPNGRVDLAGRVIEVGVVNKTTNVFTASSTPNTNSQEYRIAVRFAVENIGDKRSPQFTFNAVLPSYPAHIFSSQAQQELGPGDRIEYTLAFDKFTEGTTGVFTLNIDPTGGINESNKDNNLVKYTITVKR